ncbi:hypothetical protein E4T56_gene16894 [Termitomyces sp. T112]|nr:hypothetical protein E4T56_gene16894 [Termitomyces sp. T112]
MSIPLVIVCEYAPYTTGASNLSGDTSLSALALIRAQRFQYHFHQIVALDSSKYSTWSILVIWINSRKSGVPLLPISGRPSSPSRPDISIPTWSGTEYHQWLKSLGKTDAREKLFLDPLIQLLHVARIPLDNKETVDQTRAVRPTDSINHLAEKATTSKRERIERLFGTEDET